MNDDDFREFEESLREGAQILAGAKAPARRFVVGKQQVRKIRESLSVSQGDFAKLVGVSVDTIQNWEQGRRSPAGPARVLLNIVQHEPGLLQKPWFSPSLKQGRKVAFA